MSVEFAPVSEKAQEHARALLSTLFMAIRTAQIHDSANKAFEKAIGNVHEAASQLIASANGFQIQFVEQSVYLNGTRLRFESSLLQTVRALESALSSKEIGGLTMRVRPTFDAVRTLVLELAKEGEAEVHTLEALDIEVLGIQSFDQDERIDVDPKLLAVQSYAKLILSLREHFNRIRRERSDGKPAPLRLRVVRIIQDLVEVAGDRPDYLMRLATNQGGAELEVLHGVNSCLISVVMGTAVRLERADIVDLAMGALFHHIGSSADQVLDDDTRDVALARVLAAGSVSPASLTRAVTVAHHRKRADGRCEFRREPPHLFARIVGVAVTFSQLVSGYGTKSHHRADPLDALRVLAQDQTGRFDPDVVDLLINALRAYPIGTHVLLETGEHAIVASVLGSSRWDRPVVAVRGDNPRNQDLMVRDGDRFKHRIVGTARYMGMGAALTETEKLLPQQIVTGQAIPEFVPIDGPEPARTPPPPKIEESLVPTRGLLDVAVQEESEDLDELFKEFLATGEEKAKPSIDTSYSSSKADE